VVVVVGDDAEELPEVQDLHPLLPAVVEPGDLPVHREAPLRDRRARRAPQHAQLGLGPAVVHGRVDEHRLAFTGGDDVLLPQVAVVQARRLLRDQLRQGGAEPLQGPALLAVERRVDQRLGEPAQDAPLGEEDMPVLLPGVVLAQPAEPAVAVPAEPVADGGGVQGGDRVAEPLPERLVVAARLHLLEHEQPPRREQHVGGVHSGEVAERGEPGGFDFEHVEVVVVFMVEEGLGEELGPVFERDQPGDGDHAADCPLHMLRNVSGFAESVRQDFFV
jgi:hypothetical protein